MGCIFTISVYATSLLLISDVYFGGDGGDNNGLSTFKVVIGGNVFNCTCSLSSSSVSDPVSDSVATSMMTVGSLS